MKRITSVLAAAALTFGAAECTTDPPVRTENSGQEISQGTLTLESTDWVKGTTKTPTVSEYEVEEGTVVTTDDGHDIMMVDSLTEEEITVTLYGWYRTPSGTGENPTLTLNDGQSVSYTTDSEDAGTNYVLTYNN